MRQYSWFHWYVGATYVAISRVHANKHYPEDVIAGAAIGIGTSFFFTEPYKDIHVTPVAGDGYLGLAVTGSW